MVPLIRTRKSLSRLIPAVLPATLSTRALNSTTAYSRFASFSLLVREPSANTGSAPSPTPPVTAPPGRMNVGVIDATVVSSPALATSRSVSMSEVRPPAVETSATFAVPARYDSPVGRRSVSVRAGVEASGIATTSR